MRMLISLVVIVYLVGIGIVLAPTVRGKWNDATAADLSASVIEELPGALTWPAAVFRNLTGQVDSAHEPQVKTP